MKDLNLIKKIVLRLCVVAAVTLLVMVLISTCLWIGNFGISWTKPFERGSLSALIFIEFVIAGTVSTFGIVSRGKNGMNDVL